MNGFLLWQPVSPCEKACCAQNMGCLIRSLMALATRIFMFLSVATLVVLIWTAEYGQWPCVVSSLSVSASVVHRVSNGFINESWDLNSFRCASRIFTPRLENDWWLCDTMMHHLPSRTSIRSESYVVRSCELDAKNAENVVVIVTLGNYYCIPKWIENCRTSL